MPRPVMFLRTAQTEQRIEDLEKQVERIMDHLGLNNAEPPPKDLSDPDSEWEAAAPKSVERADEATIKARVRELTKPKNKRG